MKSIARVSLLLAAAGAQGQLPESPKPVTSGAVTIRPASVSVGSYEKYSMTTGKVDTVVQLSMDYRMRGGKVRMGMVYGHAMRAGDDSLAVTMAVKVWEFGRWRR